MMTEPVVTPPVAEPVVEPVVPAKEPSSSVSYETHRKLLSEKKKLQEERDALKAAQDKVLQESLEADGKKDELIDYHKNRLEEEIASKAELETQLTTIQSQQLDQKKLGAFLKSLNGRVEQEYWGLVDLDKIAVNPETGDIEQSSVQALAEEFTKTHHRVIDNPNKPKSPNEYPKGNQGNGPSLEEWNRLSASEKKKTPVPQVEGMSDFMRGKF